MTHSNVTSGQTCHICHWSVSPRTGVFLNLTLGVKVRRVPKSSNLYKALALSVGLKKNFHSSEKMNLLTLYGELFKVITDR